MGFFSFQTSDTKDSILNIHTGEHETVYLLQPNGVNIEETDYEGYGEFGGNDAYDWLADNNIDKAIIYKALTLGIEKRDLGIYIDYEYFVDTRNGKKYCYVFANLFEDLNGFENYGVDIDGSTPNELIKDGIWIKHSMSDYFGEIKFPLKFSYNEDADYNKLGASEPADNQGFFI